MDDLIEDLGIGSFLYQQVKEARRAALAAGRTVELFSNTIYEFRLDREELHVQDLDVLYIGENARPLVPDGRPMTVKHIRREASECRGVLYRLNTPVNRRNVLKDATRFEQAVVLFEPGNDVQQVKLQIATGHPFEPGAAYAMYVTYSVSIPSREPRLFYVGSVQPQDFSDLRRQLGVTKASKRMEFQVWSKQFPFEVSFFDGTAPCVRPAATRVRKRGGLYRIERDMTCEISAAWERSRYFGIYAHWEAPDEQ